MFAQINHMAMISPHYAQLGKFYEAVFGLKTSANEVVALVRQVTVVRL